MLSILIPTYNYNCTQLVFDLHHQATDLSINFEILVADDASPDESKNNNRIINTLDNCQFIELTENVGRSRIRNLLGKQAKYDNLLFMDCDGGIKNENFLRKYLEAGTEADVIIGGLCNPDKLPDPSVSLRYFYEKANYKKRSLTERNKNPYSQFTTFCFLIKKEIFLSIKFDETITKYGHEDTLFGAELQKRKISMKHIDNPLCHLGLESNEAYLRKVRISIETLLSNQKNLKEHSHLFIAYNKLKKFKMQAFLLPLFNIFRSTLEKNLLSHTPNMKFFALYKLGYLCYLDKQKDSQ